MLHAHIYIFRKVFAHFYRAASSHVFTILPLLASAGGVEAQHINTQGLTRRIKHPTAAVACAKTSKLGHRRRKAQIFEPAVKEGIRRGIDASGPYPADTVFVRARGGAFDAVLTMYHDQGQIAMKLMGFDRGVTLLGGFPFPICTPAHGTAYDIAWKGIANVGASRAAFLMAAKMAAEKLVGKAA